MSRFFELFWKSYWLFVWCLLYCNHRRTRASTRGIGVRRYPDTRNPGFHGTVTSWKPKCRFRIRTAVYGGLSQWAVEKLPKILIRTSTSNRMEDTPMGCWTPSQSHPKKHKPWGIRQWADLSDNRIRSIENPETLCFLSMEGKPKNTFVWTSEQVRHSTHGVPNESTIQPNHRFNRISDSTELHNTEDYAKGNCSLNFEKYVHSTQRSRRITPKNT